MQAIVGSGALAAIMLWSLFSVSSARADLPPSSRVHVVASYYPHWVSRQGDLTPRIMRRLAPGTIIGAHHGWSLREIRRILDFPGKRFIIAWYAESNTREADDSTAVGVPVAARIAEARRKQETLSAEYGAERFADLMELDASRDKKDGALRGAGNGSNDWLADARAVKAAGFRYVAKSPKLAHVRELREKLGDDFVPRVVFEDVTASPRSANPGYRADAKRVALSGEVITLIVHEGSYGGFPGTSRDRADRVIADDFDIGNVEAYWGRPSGFAKLKDFASSPQAQDGAVFPVSAPPQPQPGLRRQR